MPHAQAAAFALLAGKQRGAASLAAAAAATNMHSVLQSPSPPSPVQNNNDPIASFPRPPRERRLSGSSTGSRGGSLTPTAAARRRHRAAAVQASPSRSRAGSPLHCAPAATSCPPSPSMSAALNSLAILSQPESLPPPSPCKTTTTADVTALGVGGGGPRFGNNAGMDLSLSNSGGGSGGLARRTARLQLDPLLRRAVDGHAGEKGGREPSSSLLAPNPTRLVLKRQRTLDDSCLSPRGSSPALPTCEWMVPTWRVYPSYPTLTHLTSEVEKGLRCGLSPIITPPPAVGGSYFCRDPLGRLTAVFKPLDEEAYAAHNPRGYLAPSTHTKTITSSSQTSTHSPGLGLRAGIPPGEAGVREAAAFVLDSGGNSGVSAGVPPTVLVRLRCPAKFGPLAKPGSLQLYMAHVGSADDFGPVLFHRGDCHRIMLLDLRILNQDRHAGNILCVQAAAPRGGEQGGPSTVGGKSRRLLLHRFALQGETEKEEEWGAVDDGPPPTTPSFVSHGVLQPFNLPQPSHAASSSSSFASLPKQPERAMPQQQQQQPTVNESSPLTLRRTHSFGPTLEGTSGSSSGSLLRSGSSSSSFSSPGTFPFPLPYVRQPSSLRGSLGVGGSGLRHEASTAMEEEEEEEEDEGVEEEGAMEGDGEEEKEEEGDKLRLIPIDHGFALPHPLRIDEAELCWLHWPQAKQPVSRALRAAALALDADADVARVKATLGDVAVDGEGLPAHCLLTLRMGTALVREGIGRLRLTPFDLASLLVGGAAPGAGDGGGGGGGRSRFEALVEATYRRLAAEVKQQQEQSQQPPRLTQGRAEPQQQPQRLLAQEAWHPRFMEIFEEGLRAELDALVSRKQRGASS